MIATWAMTSLTPDAAFASKRTGIRPGDPGRGGMAIDAPPELIRAQQLAQPFGIFSRPELMPGRPVPARTIRVARQAELVPVPARIAADGRQPAIERAEGVREDGLVSTLADPRFNPDLPGLVAHDVLHGGIRRVGHGPFG
jgi:hypothetical protein